MPGPFCSLHIEMLSFIYQKLLLFFSHILISVIFNFDITNISPIMTIAVAFLCVAGVSIKRKEGHFILYTFLLYLFAPVALIWYAPGLFGRGGRKGGGKKGAISGFMERFGYIEKSSGNPVWIHAASVGEVGAATRVIGEIRERFPGLPIVLSMNTPAGREVAEKNLRDVKIFYFPFDLPPIIKRSTKLIMPRLVIILEAEIWPNFLKEVTKHAPVALINARMSEKTYRRFKMIRGFSEKVIGFFSLISAQSETYKKRYIDLGYDPEKIKISGNIKYDIEPGPDGLQDDLKDYVLAVSKGPQKIMIAGSTHRGEEDEIIEAFLGLQRSLGRLFLILAPRHLNRIEEVESLLKKRGLSYIKRTELSKGSEKSDIEVLLLDTIGELSGLLNYGDVIFIGGSLIKGVGGHNVLEAAALGKAVLFGPNMGNFPDISRELLDSGGGFVVKDAGEIKEVAATLITDEEISRSAGKKAFEVVKRNRGAIKRCIDSILPFLEGDR